MITPDMLVFIIASFCGFKDPNISQSKKIDCSEYLVNCIIKQDGKTTNKIVDKCREQWVEIERSRK